MITHLLALHREIAEMKRVIAGMVRTGTVAERDPQRGYRVNFGTDEHGKPVLSPWYPHPENGGALKTSFPLSVGQTVTTLNPQGDARQGVVLRGGGFSDQNPAPSGDFSENAFTFGSYTFKLKGDALEITSGAQALLFHADGSATIKASRITLDGPVEMPQGFSAGAGKGTVATINGEIHSKSDIRSDTRVTAPVLQGRIT